MYPMVELYVYYSLNNQYVEGGQNEKKAYLTSMGNIAMWVDCSLVEIETVSLLLREQR